ncbi:MAG: DUF3810 domain-containing protein [Sphingobacteriia bacterium]|nr:MAG: DUF3810 domain-containing protein [Sphingobacteriia bacterium]
MSFSIIIQEKRIKSNFWLIIGSILVYIIGFYPDFVEKWYSLGFYPLFAKSLRFGTGCLGFSIGDLLYIALGGWILIRFIQFIRLIYRNGIGWNLCFKVLGNLVKWICIVYISFNLVWGLNYHRQGIAHQLDIQKDHYTKVEIQSLTNELIERTNFYRKAISTNDLPVYSFNKIKQEALLSYYSTNQYYPFLKYPFNSIKASSFNSIADYVGFTGYYNPFSGEAQLRTDIPSILLPFTTCHEIAHQLGYASESEANFVGFLTASKSSNPYFRYSAYLEMLNYALSEEFLLFARDSSFKDLEAVIRYNKSHIDTLVKKDRKEIRQFFNQRKNKIAPISADLYDQYLKLNKQLAGINSYDEVIGWLIAYKTKKGSL